MFIVEQGVRPALRKFCERTSMLMVLTSMLVQWNAEQTRCLKLCQGDASIYVMCGRIWKVGSTWVIADKDCVYLFFSRCNTALPWVLQVFLNKSLDRKTNICWWNHLTSETREILKFYQHGNLSTSCINFNYFDGLKAFDVW